LLHYGRVYLKNKGIKLKESVYIETTIISYLAGKPSRDLVVAAHQRITAEWWAQVTPKVELFVSPFVIEECERGDKEAAQRRKNFLKGIKVLELESGIQKIAEIYFEKLEIPEKARLDAAHIAIACYYKMDYFVTWNCVHIASAKTRRSLELLNKQLRLFTPVICTPEELMEV